MQKQHAAASHQKVVPHISTPVLLVTAPDRMASLCAIVCDDGDEEFGMSMPSDGRDGSPERQQPHKGSKRKRGRGAAASASGAVAAFALAEPDLQLVVAPPGEGALVVPVNTAHGGHIVANSLFYENLSLLSAVGV